MECYLLKGIWKAAFIVPTGGRSQLKPWGGTTADVGSSYEGNMLAHMAGWGLGGKIHKGLLGAGAKGAIRFGAPIAGIAELGYGLTKGVSDARKKGAKFGRELGKSNMFLAGRL